MRNRTPLNFCLQRFLDVALPVVLVGVVLTELQGGSLPDGSLDGLTGSPGEFSCGYTGSCHSGKPLNESGGTLTLSGPEMYGPCDTLEIRIDLAREGQRRWGFMITALDIRDSAAGQLVVSDSLRTRYGEAINRQYIKQTIPGTDAGVADTAPGWSVLWVAPDTSVGDVIFYVAGNAANGDGLPSGDYIYTKQKTVSADFTTSVGEETENPLPTSFELSQNYPNPFNPSTRIDLKLAQAAEWRIDIYNLSGRRVETFSGFSFAEIVSVEWNASEFASGVYFYKATSGGIAMSRKMVLLK
ncbi:MAG: T9SS type A sorting domain-containing protein [candidate division Zixibacteria bacterium]|nr:T9SS type A sorting domain-containing protein [candidate division Zixibacteria bacterium]